MKELLSGSLFSKIPFVPQILSRPAWLASFLIDGGVPDLENIVVPGQGPMPLIDVTASLGKSAVTWADLGWIRESWNGPIVIKGVLIAEDARRAADEGAAAIVVSNHGARQLDHVLPTVRALPEIVAAVGQQIEILMDGGIRRGSDIVKALCLGAHAVLIGRAYAYGLAAGGEAGVARAIQILRNDVERTMRLLGCGSVGELNRSYIECPCEWERTAKT
jgi:L-lactate dehydrogenase (cytochrome)